ncbi:MAG TPA: helix-turn-helix domain-containing protein [Xanthobacteraceae bacterium]|nr:helix-turn-helix domain-containing protein [Xanthobacteraceae bacterium]
MSRNPSSTDAHVGKRLRMRRLMLRMSQEMLADALGVTFQQVQKYEKGINRISAGRLRDISRIVGLPIQFFFEGLPETKAETKGSRDALQALASDFLASSDGIAIAKTFNQIKSRAIRRSIVQVIKSIAAFDTVKK